MLREIRRTKISRKKCDFEKNRKKNIGNSYAKVTKNVAY